MCLESPDHPDSSDSQSPTLRHSTVAPLDVLIPGPGPHPPVAETDLAAWRHRLETMEVP